MKNNKIIPKREAHLSKISEDLSDSFTKGKLKHRFNIKSQCYAVRSVNIGPGDRHLVITNADNSLIRVIDLALLEYKTHSYNGHKSSVRLTSITKDGSAFYTASWDGGCHRYEIETGKRTRILDIGGLPMPSCFISPDEQYLFTAHYESVNGLNSRNRGRCIDLIKNKSYEYVHQNRNQYPAAMDIAYDGKHVYTGSDDGIAIKWSLKKQIPLIQFFNLPVTVRKLVVSKRYLAIACSDGIVRIYNKTSGRKYKQIVYNTDEEAMDVRMTSDESKMVVAYSDGTIMCYDLMADKTIFHHKAHYGNIWSICLYNNDQKIVSGSTDGSIVFMTMNGDLLARYFNLASDDLLISSPPEEDKNKIFPDGCFFTTNNKLVSVYRFDEHNLSKELLDESDRDRLEYINRLNRKNIIISKLRNHKNYELLSGNYSKHKKLLDGLSSQKTIRLLK